MNVNEEYIFLYVLYIKSFYILSVHLLGELGHDNCTNCAQSSGLSVLYS